MSSEMSRSVESSGSVIHIGLLPSAGMGHLIPSLRLAHTLLRHNTIKLTLIASQPPVSSAETLLISRFLSHYPQVTELPLHITPNANPDSKDDPFFRQFDAIRKSVHLLDSPLSALQPPLTALVSDVSLIIPVIQLTNTLRIPHYVLFPSSPTMFSLFSHYPFANKSLPSISIPGVASIPNSSLPPPILVPDSIFGNIFIKDSLRLPEVQGILINDMDAMEGSTIAALNSGMVAEGLPPVISVGPLLPCEFENLHPTEFTITSWLDKQPPESVVFVCFGSRVAGSREQIREVGNGLVKSGYKFMWVVKDNVVDKEDKSGLTEVVGEELMEKINQQGMVVKSWVNQWDILSHPAVGGFLSHGGWNSLFESALNGVPVLAWPQVGDHMINSDMAVRIGFAMRVEEWGWGHKCVVKADQIGLGIKEMMEREDLRTKAFNLKQEGIKALQLGGTADTAIQTLIRHWNNA